LPTSVPKGRLVKSDGTFRQDKRVLRK
jgi:hypothetical protein